jgi:protein subunit release factor B
MIKFGVSGLWTTAASRVSALRVGSDALSSSSHVRRCCVSPLAQNDRCHQLSAIVVACRFSQVSNFKVPGYNRLNFRDVIIPESAYEVRMSRGSGPGGQGVNSSSNKVELRVRVVELLDLLDEETYSTLVRQQCGKALTSDGELLIVSSHDHRSALKNKEACVDMIKEMVVKASWVPPVEADPIETAQTTITHHKIERRKKGMALKMRSSARQGKW